jgi:flagellar biosynthetic protein FliR
MDLTQAIAEMRQQLGLQVDFTQVMLAFALLEARVLPVVLLTPFLGGESVPSEVKLSVGLLLGMVLFPAIIVQIKHVPVTPMFFIALMLKELFIGLVLSYTVGMVFDAAQAAGGLIDIMSGTNQAQLMVPQTAQNVSLFANLQMQLVTVTFLTLGGHHLVIGALGESVNQIPLDQFPRFSHGFWPLFDLAIRVAGDMFRIALALASPVLLATFLTDLALGMINRVAPQVQVFFIAMQIKPAVTIVIMFFAIHLVLDRVVVEFGVMFQWLHKAVWLFS